MAFNYGRYGDCHLLGHAWETVPSDWTPAYGGNPMTMRCMRCSMERRDTVGTNSGEVVNRRYVEPEGYYWKRDSDEDVRPTRSDYRWAWIEQNVLTNRRTRKRRSAA